MLPVNHCEQPIAALGDGLDVGRVTGIVAECLSEFDDGMSQGVLGDELGLPGPVDEIAFGHHLTGVLGKAAEHLHHFGFETEIVAVTNPYTDDLSNGFSVKLYYRQDTRPDTQVEVFRKASDGTVTIDLYRTDDQGIATFPVEPGLAYMVDAVVLREPSEELMASTNAVWETLWANLTFAVPE